MTFKNGMATLLILNKNYKFKVIFEKCYVWFRVTTQPSQ